MNVRATLKRSTVKFSVFRAAISFLFLVGVVGAVVAWLSFHDQTNQEIDLNCGPFAAKMKYLPNSISDVAFCQFDLARLCPAYAQLGRGSRFGPIMPRSTNRPDVIREIKVYEPIQVTIQMWRRAPTTRDLFDRNERVTELEVNGKTIYTPRADGYLIDGKQVVIAPAFEFGHLLNSPHEVPFTGQMERAIQEIDFGKPEVHVWTIEQPYGLGCANCGLSAALLKGQFPLTVMTDFDYQIPMTMQIRLYCRDAADAKSRAGIFRMPEVMSELGPLGKCVVEVNDSTVTLRATMSPSDISRLPN
jgi:hypothetical protein